MSKSRKWQNLLLIDLPLLKALKLLTRWTENRVGRTDVVSRLLVVVLLRNLLLQSALCLVLASLLRVRLGLLRSHLDVCVAVLQGGHYVVVEDFL